MKNYKEKKPEKRKNRVELLKYVLEGYKKETEKSQSNVKIKNFINKLYATSKLSINDTLLVNSIITNKNKPELSLLNKIKYRIVLGKFWYDIKKKDIHFILNNNKKTIKYLEKLVKHYENTL